MKIAIMQPYYFPYIGYWQLLAAVDTFVVFDDVNYIKRGWINRNRIQYQNNEKYMNVYLKGASQNKLINEIQVNEGDRRNINNLTIIKDAYKNAPMFYKVYPLVEKIICKDENNLALFLGNLIDEVKKYLGIETELLYSSEIEKDNSLRGQDKIIEICKKLNANQYLNAIGGRGLYDGKEFLKHDIKLYFLKTGVIKYQQFGTVFHENLSIIDVMMFNEVKQIRKFLFAYELLEG